MTKNLKNLQLKKKIDKLLWVIFALPDPYSEYGSGSQTLVFFLPSDFCFRFIFFLKSHAEYFACKKLCRIFFFWKKNTRKKFVCSCSVVLLNKTKFSWNGARSIFSTRKWGSKKSRKIRVRVVDSLLMGKITRFWTVFITFFGTKKILYGCSFFIKKNCKKRWISTQYLIPVTVLKAVNVIFQC